MRLVCQYGNLVDEGSFWCRNCTRGCAPNQLSYVLDPTEQLDDLIIVDRVAVFPTSALYHATRGNLHVLLKVAHKDRHEALKRELQVLWQIDRHPGFLHPISASSSGERPYGKFALRGEMKYYGVYEYVNGTLLREVLNANPQPSTRYVGWLSVALLDAVMYLHHRFEQAICNLSPDNILIRHDKHGVPRPMLLDLCQLVGFRDTVRLSTSGNAYIAPEAVQAQPVGPHSDVYSIGTLLYEMLAGQLPIGAQHSHSVEGWHAGVVEPVSLARIRPDLNQSLIAVTEQATQRSVSERIPNVQRLGRELVSIFGVPPPEKKRFPIELNAAILGLLGGLVILLIAMVAILV